MIAETENLLKQGYSEHCAALTGLGYHVSSPLLKGELSKEECYVYSSRTRANTRSDR